MITVQNSTIVIENLTNATAVLTSQNRVEIQMNDGYVFWDKANYYENGVFVQPEPDEISYYRRGSYVPTKDFSTMIEAVESTVPADQIFGGGNADVKE